MTGLCRSPHFIGEEGSCRFRAEKICCLVDAHMTRQYCAQFWQAKL